MRRQMWPDGVQPQTQPPLFVVLGGENYGLDESPDGGAFDGPVVLQLQSGTQGASIAYTFDDSDEPHWQLYHEPVALPAGTTCVRARAGRIGYAPSEEKTADFIVQ